MLEELKAENPDFSERALKHILDDNTRSGEPASLSTYKLDDE